jgi:hypothetical protein
MWVRPLLACFQCCCRTPTREGLSGSNLRRRRQRSGQGGISCGAGGEEGMHQNTAYRGGAISSDWRGYWMNQRPKLYRREQLQGVNRWT